MAYLFRQKISLQGLASLDAQAKRILIFEPQIDLFNLYKHYLQNHNFEVLHCPQPNQTVELLKSFLPHVLLFNTDSSLGFSTVSSPWVMLRNIMKSFPGLRLISVGLHGEENVKEFLSLGVVCHINRSFFRPNDLAEIVKSVLN